MRSRSEASEQQQQLVPPGSKVMYKRKAIQPHSYNVWPLGGAFPHGSVGGIPKQLSWARTGVCIWGRWEVREDREALTHCCPLSTSARTKQTATQAVSHSQSCDEKHMRLAGRATEAEGVKTVWGLLSRSGVVMLSPLLSFGPPPLHLTLTTALCCFDK